MGFAERLEALNEVLERTRKLEFEAGRDLDFTLDEISVEDFQVVYGNVLGRLFKYLASVSYVFSWGPSPREWKQEIVAQIKSIGNIRPYN